MPASPMIANGLVRGVLPALGQQKTPATIPHSHRRGKEFRHRSFHAAGQPTHAQIGGRSRCPWVAAGDRSFPSVLARTWHGLEPEALVSRPSRQSRSALSAKQAVPLFRADQTAIRRDICQPQSAFSQPWFGAVHLSLQSTAEICWCSRSEEQNMLLPEQLDGSVVALLGYGLASIF